MVFKVSIQEIILNPAAIPTTSLDLLQVYETISKRRETNLTEYWGEECVQ